MYPPAKAFVDWNLVKIFERFRRLSIGDIDILRGHRRGRLKRKLRIERLYFHERCPRTISDQLKARLSADCNSFSFERRLEVDIKTVRFIILCHGNDCQNYRYIIAGFLWQQMIRI